MSSRSNGLSIFGIIAIIALLGLSAYLWMNNSSLKGELSDIKQEHLQLQKAQTELEQTYEQKLSELEELRGDNEELNAMIDEQKSDLAKMKKRVSGLIWTERELGKVREEMTNLQTQADQYISEITKLKQQNQDLSSQNQKLTMANTEMNETIEVNKKRINKLDSVKTLLVSQTEELSETNNMLSSKVDMAEAIKINFLEVKGYDVKDDGSLKEKGRAKKVELLRLCFTTETNLVTKAGEEEFQIAYTSPIGELLYVEDLGSGRLTNKLTGETVRYTTSGTVDYNNDDLNACLDWRPNFALGKGEYSVQIFNNGFEVGKGSFRLK